MSSSGVEPSTNHIGYQCAGTKPKPNKKILYIRGTYMGGKDNKNSKRKRLKKEIINVNFILNTHLSSVYPALLSLASIIVNAKPSRARRSAK